MPALLSASTTALDEPALLGHTDTQFLRQAIALACIARARGNHPFGAVIVGADGRVLAQAYCTTTESGDATGHAEMNALRRLSSPHATRETRAQATLYASAEPCAMCAGAIFWSGIGRIVYGIDTVRLRRFFGTRTIPQDLGILCRDVLATASRPIEIIGPALLEEACAPHTGFWSA